MEIISCNCYQEKWNGICLLFGKKFFEEPFKLNKSAVDAMEKICSDFFNDGDVNPTCVYDAKQIYTVCNKCLDDKLFVKTINTQNNYCLSEYYKRNVALSNVCRSCLNKAILSTSSDFNKITL